MPIRTCQLNQIKSLTSGNGTGLIFIMMIWLVPALVVLFHADNCHDWGDDFAQYLCQSGFINGSYQQMPVTCLEHYSPAVRGPLFSLVLIPALLFPLPVLAGKCLILFFLAASGHLLFLLLRNVANNLVAFSGALLLMINYTSLRLADQVLPDIPFTFLVLWSIYFFDSASNRSRYAGLFLGGLSVGFRSAGWVLVLIYFFRLLFSAKQEERSGSETFRMMLMLFFPVLFTAGMSRLVFGSLDTEAWYVSKSLDAFSFSVFLSNCTVYRDAFLTLFEYEIPMWVSRLAGNSMGALVLTGFLYRMICKRGIMDFFFAAYLLLILIYPYRQEPHRFLFPLFPFMMLYSAVAIDFSSRIVKVPNRASAKISLLLFFGLLLFNFNNIRAFFENNRTDTVCEADTGELFRFLTHETVSGAKVACEKPWAVAWYAGIETVPLSCRDSDIDYEVLKNEAPLLPASTMEIVFSNTTWSVFKKN